MGEVFDAVWAEVAEERTRQDRLWGGGGGVVHDDEHTPQMWGYLLGRHVGRAMQEPFRRLRFRRQLVIVAALAVAAIEAVDRAAAQEVGQ